MAGATDQIRRSLQRVAVRIRARIDPKDNGLVSYVLRIIAEEFEAEAEGKKQKP